MMPPPQPPQTLHPQAQTSVLHHFPPNFPGPSFNSPPQPSTPTPYFFSPAHSFSSSTPELPDLFPPQQGYSFPGPTYMLGPPTQVPPRPPPPSPTHQKLRPCEDVINELKDWLVPGKVVRLAIKLAKDCVFGTDIMARGNLNKDRLSHIRYILQ